MKNDRILFSSDVLNYAADDVEKLADALEYIINTLQDVDTGKVNNEKMNIDSRMNALIRASKSRRDDAQSIIQSISKAISAFEEAESTVAGLLDGKSEGPSSEKKKENPYGLTDEELEYERRAVIQNMLEILATQNEGLNKVIDRKKLSKLTEGVGGWFTGFYTAMAGDPSKLAQSDAREIALAMLDTLSAKQDTSSMVLEMGDTMKDVGEFTADTFFDGLNMYIPDLGDEVEAALKKKPTVKKLTAAGMTVEYAQHLLDAYNQYKKMTSMDPQKLESICSGMRASGNAEMSKAADILESFKDPYYCGVYCLATNGFEIAASKLSEETRDALVGLYPDAIGQGIIKISARSTEALTNSSGIMEEVHQIERLDDARQSAYKTVQQAADAYNRNPTDENYQKVLSAHDTYEALAAESLDAYADMIDAKNDSGLGKIFKDDPQSARNLANMYRGFIGDGALEMYAPIS